jgi:hypothetical protein
MDRPLVNPDDLSSAIQIRRWLRISSIGYAARFRNGPVASLRVVNRKTVAYEAMLDV